ncbi:MAG: hypothetical protein P8J86_11875 [Phycisphaerales bacterium]|nr:hypothetical protein [Phycisphaerales bacterium]
MTKTASEEHVPKLYDGEGDALMHADRRADRVVLLPAGNPKDANPDGRCVRIQWGQHLLNDMLSRRYRTLICGVNPDDNANGIIGHLADLLPTSQWNADSITMHARTFASSASPDDVLVLKYDMDAVEVLALLRHPDRDHFTLNDIAGGFRKIGRMLEHRYDRLPCASISFLGAKSNRLVDASGNEPSFETVLRTMHESGYCGDVYPSLRMWELAPTGVFASYPYSESIEKMRDGGF